MTLFPDPIESTKSVKQLLCPVCLLIIQTVPDIKLLKTER